MPDAFGRPHVLVVGAGPAGLVTAIGLATYGIDVRIVDEKAAPSENSRAVGIQARSLEVFEQLGVVDDFLARGRRAGGAPSAWTCTRRSACSRSTCFARSRARPRIRSC